MADIVWSALEVGPRGEARAVVRVSVYYFPPLACRFPRHATHREDWTEGRWSKPSGPWVWRPRYFGASIHRHGRIRTAAPGLVARGGSLGGAAGARPPPLGPGDDD